MHDDLLKKIEELAEDIAKYYGCYIVGALFVSSLKNKGVVLRIYADAEGGVNISQLTDISKELSMILDIKELIDFKYNLEISSPGIDRVIFKIKDYIRFKDKRVKISLNEKINGRLNFVGKIIDVSDITNKTGEKELLNANIKIYDEIDNKNYVIPFLQIKKANLIAE
ncbi:MAG: ribosome maturation factor RimP [Deltaproteobacteria bacterium]|uniref:Ribosome maturation factor RimP n=1 Tax=Candidatus Acididesulfobacter diazotrophicus TaxID=2597226 RepID=A0A519BNV9_9DELT|nr:ribosome maturation factor RimP [Deltaproteobacteria bacterium]RZD18899.1 MAG: ribosome maturation factor RimP [Candidatus Acididesulfobacter diazotrophicus]